MKPSLRLEGAEELDAALKGLEGATAKRLSREAVVHALEPVEKAAIAAAPVRKGDLRNSIGIGTQLTRRQRRLREPIAPIEGYVGPGVKGGKAGRTSGVRHGHLQEFGTAKTAPQPFLRPAWVRNMKTVFDRLGKRLWSNIERNAKRRRRG